MKKILLSLFCLVFATATHALILQVNDSGDEHDATPGDGQCETALSNGVCTLRAAIEEGNSVTDQVSVIFSFNMAIDLGADLPPVTRPMLIQSAGVGQAEVIGHGHAGFDVRGGTTTLYGLTINGCSTGIILRNPGKNNVQDCFLGTDFFGTNAKPNQIGLHIIDSPSNRVDGIVYATLISGNDGDGVLVEGAASIGTTFRGVRFGVDNSGSNALGNAGNGLHIIGAPGASMDRCLVGGNAQNGILLENANRFMAQQTFIGTDNFGNFALGNGLSGIVIKNSANCLLGGIDFSGPLIISGNNLYGIEITGSASISNQVGLGRVFIGTGVQTNALGNGAGGVLIDGAVGNYIDAFPKQIIIGYNGGPGVTIAAGTENVTGTHVKFLSNTGPGIDLGADGPTENDSCDTDEGANHLLNYPVITSMTNTPSGTTVMGTLNSTPFTLFTIELYSSTACNQGEELLGSAATFPDGSCNGTFSITFTNVLAPGTYINALTRRRPGISFFDQNVSEFSPTCEPQPELLALEVTQAVQDWDNSIPVVTGKTTFVRAYIQGGTNYVSGKLHGFRNNVELPGPLDPLNAGGRILPPDSSAAERSVWNSTLNFLLPPSWADGSVKLQLVAPGVLCAGDCSTTVDFLPSAIPEVRFVDIDFVGAAGETNRVSIFDIDRMAKRLKRIFPVHDVKADLGRTMLVEDGRSPTKDDLATFNLLLKDRRTRDGCGAGCKRLYYGVFKITDSDPGGLAISLPGDVASGAVDADGDSYSSNRHAHELGHLLGRPHAVANMFSPGGSKIGFCDEFADSNAVVFPYFFNIEGMTRATLGPMDSGAREQVFGLDVINPGDPELIDPNITFELMSYCKGIVQPRRWISKFTYEALRTAINSRFAARPAIAGAIVPQDYLLVAGTIDTQTLAATLSPFGVITTSDPPETPEPGNSSLQLLDDVGGVLADISFQPVISEPDAPADESTIGTFLIAVPFNAQFKQAVVRHNAQVVAERTASTNAPTVQVLFPNGGENISGDEVMLTWAGNDADGDALVYTVQYSADGGATWTTLALNSPQQSLLVDTVFLAGSANALIRVQASDGFNTGTDVSDAPFTVANHPPTLEIASPTEQQLYTGEQAVVLDASVNDIEDGTAGVQWTSNLDGALGSGKTLQFTSSSLSAGTHLITAVATDTQSATATDVVQIVVAREVPAALADISITKSASNDASTVVYTMIIANSGPNVATGITLVDELPATLGFDSGDTTQGSCNENAGTVTCNLGTLPAGSNVVVRIFATASETAVVTNNANVTANQTDPIPANNSASAVLSVTAAPIAGNDLALVKLKAPKKITFKSGIASVTGKFSVSIQNLGPADEVIPNFATLQTLVNVNAVTLGACSDVPATMSTPKAAFPITLKPKKKLNLAFTANFTTNCVNDPLPSSKTASHFDYRAEAEVHLAGDTNTDNNSCPRAAAGIDKGCKEVLIDVIVK